LPARIPPWTTEAEFIGLSKVYFLSHIAQTLVEYEVKTTQPAKLLPKLHEADLLPPTVLRMLAAAGATQTRRQAKAALVIAGYDLAA
jgi:hypothetical protein